MGSSKELANITVLVAEDEPLVAAGVVDQLVEAGATVVGPCSTVAQAIAALEQTDVDVAVVDYVLANDNSGSVQAALEKKGVPFVVITGYPRALVRRDQRQRVLSKPIAPEVLTSTLTSLARA